MKAYLKKLLILLGILALFLALWYGLGLSNYFGINQLQAHQQYMQRMVVNHYIFSALLFIGIYTAIIASAIPASAPLTLLGSYLFGFIPGFLYSFTASVLGATISFLVIRYVVKSWFGASHSARVEQFNVQFQKYGASYLLMLHFLSVIPYIVITMLAALAKVPLKTFVWTVAVGSIPLLALYSWTAQELASFTSVRDIFSVRVILLLGLLMLIAIMPILVRRFKHRVSV